MNLWYSFHFFLQSCHSLHLFFFYYSSHFLHMSDRLVLLTLSLHCPSGWILAFWNKIIYFNLLFLLVAFFRRWWPFPLVFRRTSFSINTRLSLVLCNCYTSFCILFDWISVAFLGICFIIFTFEMISFVLNGFGELCPIYFVDSVRCCIILVVIGNLERLF